MTRNQRLINAAFISAGINAALALVKWTAGNFGNSYALIADAIESTTDIFTSFLLIIGLRYAIRPADKNHPYGHGRAEPLITFVVVCFLVASAVVIAVNSIKNIRTPHQLPAPYTLFALAGVVITKELFFRRINRIGGELHSTSLKAEAWHHRSDAITSAAAFIGIIVSLILGPGYEAADDWAALLTSFFILYNGWLLFRPALGEIMDEHFYEDLVESIHRESLKVEGVRGTEKCYVRKTGMSFRVELHAIVDADISVRQGHVIAHLLKAHLLTRLPELADVLVHIEPDEEV